MGMVHIPFDQKHIDYMLELLNNERYTGNANAQLAESLMARIVASESTANSEAAAEDAYWSAREARQARRLKTAHDAGFDTWEEYLMDGPDDREPHA